METVPTNLHSHDNPPPNETELADTAKTVNSFSIPEQYKDKPYLTGVDSIEKVYDMLDNAQKTIGKRPLGIPQDTAPKEDWDSFYNAMGRPDNAEGYSFDDVEFPEGHQVDEEFLSASKQAMYDIGLNNKQASGLKKWFDNYSLNIINQQGEAQEVSDNEFNDLASKHFGNEKDKAIANAKILLAENVPDGFKERLGSLNNSDLVMMAGVLNNIQKKYINEDSLANKEGTARLTKSRAEMQKEARDLMMNPAYRNKGHFDHDKIKEKVDSIYRNLPNE